MQAPTIPFNVQYFLGVSQMLAFGVLVALFQEFIVHLFIKKINHRDRQFGRFLSIFVTLLFSRLQI
jgi:hypothetical protein